MATKTLTSFNGLIADKTQELKNRLKELKSTDCTLSENTISTQIFKANREIKILTLIADLINGTVSDKDKETLVSLTTLASERKQAGVQVKEGDSILDLMKKYQNVKKLSDKLEKACEKAGLRLDYNAGKVVKA